MAICDFLNIEALSSPTPSPHPSQQKKMDTTAEAPHTHHSQQSHIFLIAKTIDIYEEAGVLATGLHKYGYTKLSSVDPKLSCSSCVTDATCHEIQ